MQSVLTTIVIILACLWYIFNPNFRHNINVMLMWTFKIPFLIISWIDYHTCSKYYIRKEPLSEKSTLKKSTKIQQTIKEINEESPLNIKSVRKDGKEQFVVSDEELQKLIARNPELKIEQN